MQSLLQMYVTAASMSLLTLGEMITTIETQMSSSISGDQLKMLQAIMSALGESQAAAADLIRL